MVSGHTSRSVGCLLEEGEEGEEIAVLPISIPDSDEHWDTVWI